MENGDHNGAVRLGEASNDFVARTLPYALIHRKKSISDALLRAAGGELKRYNRGLAVLDTAITLAPLLGLLGTVTGMIYAFELLGGQEIEAPQARGWDRGSAHCHSMRSGGRHSCLASLQLSHAQLEEARHDIQDAATHLEPCLDQSGRRASRSPIMSWQRHEHCFVQKRAQGAHSVLYPSVILIGGPLGEEPGWRGFALPRLQQKLGPLAGSLVPAAPLGRLAHGGRWTVTSSPNIATYVAWMTAATIVSTIQAAVC